MSKQDALPADLKPRIKASYDAIAETYNEEFHLKVDDPFRIDYLRRLVSKLRSKESTTSSSVDVLELGCGAGIPATKFLLDSEDPLFNITGNDISTTQLDFARSNLANYTSANRLTLLEGDMLALSFPDATFDAVTAFYSIIHLAREEQTQLMRQIARWIKPGGYFLANFLVQDLPTLALEKWLEHESGWMFWSSWGEEGSVKMVEAVGLGVELREVRQAVGDEAFVWMLARKGV